MPEGWYEQVAAATELTQGDFVTNCPLIGWGEEAELSRAEDAETLRTASRTLRADVVVLTQSCDLEQEKVRNVIVCPHLPLSEYKEAWDQEMKRRGQNPSDRSWQRHCDDICAGFVWNLTILNEDKRYPEAEHRVVDFHEIFTIPKGFLQSLLLQRGQPRLRLRPPYREYLSQAFARFFMRVGLPVSVTKVW